MLGGRLGGDVDALGASEPFDVCIIGSGFGGITLAQRLVDRGLRTLLIESGDGLVSWLVNRRLRRLADYEFSGDTDYPRSKTKARLVGGNSNFWTGRAERFHPSDFGQHPYVPDGNPWPITYEELEPYYGSAEETLRVRGNSFSVYTAPRSTELPLPAKPDISTLRALMADVDVTVDCSATATPTRTPRFFRVNAEILPSFRNARDFALLTGATVTRLTPGERGEIVGASVNTLDGLNKTARAKVYVVSCGGIETPRLLLLSRSERFPNGIGNNHDRVGRGFNEHASVNLYGSIRHRKGTFLPRHKIARSHQFYDAYRREGLGSLLLNVIQSWVFPNHLLRFSPADIPRGIAALARRVARPTLYLGTTIEMKVSDENRVTLSETAKDPLGDPLAHLVFSYTDEDLRLLERSRELCHDIYRRLGATRIREADVNFSRHHQGTCRMGEDPRTSVTDRNLLVHETSNLYLCGAEVFVTGSAVPPTLTIVALAHRLADHLADRFRQGAPVP